ncbi:sulfatase-like hydrolase/transferase [uncultured Sneathiella sp.]|uniref:LTA synthase family protein n=1 Tax=uncultured Sneathiella sp. TaxID=879315 RepID=UPI0030ED3EB3
MSLLYFMKRLAPSFALFMIVQLSVRIIFTAWMFHALEPYDILKSLSVGIVFDLATYSLFILPYIFYLLLLPASWHNTKFDRIATHSAFVIFSSLVIFDVASEYAFWQEFSVRYNFIAVDYLVYAREVLGNIWESYPVVPIFMGIIIIVGGVYAVMRKKLIPSTLDSVSITSRIAFAGGFILLTIIGYQALSLRDKAISENNYTNEITANGIYSLFSAFKNNELSYQDFYITYEDIEKRPLPLIGVMDVRSDKPRQFKNVVFIMMESMSAEFMGRYGAKGNFTPNLDVLAKSSLNFSNLYATGTRTVRGLEALTLSIPPSPGRSIVKRPNNENLFSLGYIFKDRGYRTKFIYGGYGYFDNMNYFYENNGFEIVDRTDLSDEEVTFSNAWGVADEDLFKKTIKEAQRDYGKGKPFMYMVMTTSNHRPYTFPKNTANIPVEGGGRMAGVRYADYAIGRFLEDAKNESWFNDTIFVIVADHTAGAAGKTSLPPSRYHIPAMLYAPGLIKPQEINKLASQIDLPVTLLSVLGFDYKSRFVGRDIMKNAFVERAFIATFQKLGIYQNGTVTFVEPVKAYGLENELGTLEDKQKVASEALLSVVTNYERASLWKTNHRKLSSTLAERAQATSDIR